MSPSHTVQLLYCPEEQCLTQKLLLETGLWCLWVSNTVGLLHLLKRKGKSFSLKSPFLLLKTEGSDGMGNPNLSSKLWQRGKPFISFPPDSMIQFKEMMFWTAASRSSIASFLLLASQREICLFLHGMQVSLTINHLTRIVASSNHIFSKKNLFSCLWHCLFLFLVQVKYCQNHWYLNCTLLQQRRMNIHWNFMISIQDTVFILIYF